MSNDRIPIWLADMARQRTDTGDPLITVVAILGIVAMLIAGCV